MESNTITKYRDHIALWKDEIECYKRLQDSNCVPKLIDYSQADLSITTEKSGESLFILINIIQQKIEIINPLQQIQNFITACEQNRVVHLDPHPGNLLLHDGRLLFIDFEKVAIDGRGSTPKRHKTYLKFRSRGGWSKWLLNKYEEYFTSHYDNNVWYRQEIIQSELKKYGKTL